MTVPPERVGVNRVNERILVIEDEALIADSVAYALRREGYDVSIEHDGAEGLAKAKELVPDLIVLDLMLPSMDGFDVCRAIRAESSTPIIMLTARGEEIDRVVGLELGADDYVIKPFSMRELLARVKSVLRRSRMAPDQGPQDVIHVGNLTVDSRRRQVTVGDEIIHLSLKEFELLRVLVKNRDRVMARRALLSAVWSSEGRGSTRTLDVHIRWLREKIEDAPSAPKKIVTARGVGYMFVTPSDEQ